MTIISRHEQKHVDVSEKNPTNVIYRHSSLQRELSLIRRVMLHDVSLFGSMLTVKKKDYEYTNGMLGSFFSVTAWENYNIYHNPRKVPRSTTIFHRWCVLSDVCGWRFMPFTNYGLLASPMSRRKHKCLSSWHVLAASNTEFLIFAAIVLSSSSECHFAMSDSVVSSFLRAETSKTTEKRDFRCFKIKYLSLLEAEIARGRFDCSKQLDINGNLTICINNFLHNDSKVGIELFPPFTHRSIRRAKRADWSRMTINHGVSVVKTKIPSKFHAVTKIN